MQERVLIKRRNLWVQVFLAIVTLGIYPMYWFHVVNQEMTSHLKIQENIWLWTLMFGFPGPCLYSFYKQAELYEKFSDGKWDRWFIFVLYIFFPIPVWFVIQRDLNAIATYSEVRV